MKRPFFSLALALGLAGSTLAQAQKHIYLGNSTTTLLDTSTPQINVLAGGQVDGSWLGIRGQNGNSNFLQRFALRPHGAYDSTAAMKFALEHQNALVTGAINGDTASPYPEKTYSLLSISNPNVLLWALKPGEEGIENGVIARVWNLGAGGDYSATLTGGLTSAHRVTHIETDIGNLPVADGQVTSAIARSQLQTLRLLPSAARP